MALQEEKKPKQQLHTVRKNQMSRTRAALPFHLLSRKCSPKPRQCPPGRVFVLKHDHARRVVDPLHECGAVLREVPQDVACGTPGGTWGSTSGGTPGNTCGSMCGTPGSMPYIMQCWAGWRGIHPSCGPCDGHLCGPCLALLWTDNQSQQPRASRKCAMLCRSCSATHTAM